MKILLAIACIIAITLNAAQAAQRVPPAEVSPVIHDGIEYRVNHKKMGFIEAWDIEQDIMLWDSQVYKVHFSAWIPPLIQFIFIKDLSLEENTLYVVNERQNKFAIDLTTRQVSLLNTIFPETTFASSVSPLNQIHVGIHVFSLPASDIQSIATTNYIDASSLLELLDSGKGKLLAAPSILSTFGNETKISSQNICSLSFLAELAHENSRTVNISIDLKLYNPTHDQTAANNGDNDIASTMHTLFSTRTTFFCKDGEPILIGGGIPTNDQKDMIYLVLTARVVTPTGQKLIETVEQSPEPY